MITKRNELPSRSFAIHRVSSINRYLTTCKLNYKYRVKGYSNLPPLSFSSWNGETALASATLFYSFQAVDDKLFQRQPCCSSSLPAVQNGQKRNPSGSSVVRFSVQRQVHQVPQVKPMCPPRNLIYLTHLHKNK